MAIHFAVLYPKPVIFLMPDELEPPVVRIGTKIPADAFGETPLNIDADISRFDSVAEARMDEAR